jgi:hypothetical protein
MLIIWTKHAEQRLKEWEQKKQITRDEVERVILSPDQLISGDLNVLIAQSKRGEGLLRIAFTEIEIGRKILTFYWTSRVAKYWKDDK